MINIYQFFFVFFYNISKRRFPIYRNKPEVLASNFMSLFVLYHYFIISVCGLLLKVNKGIISLSFLIFMIINYILNEIYFNNQKRLEQILLSRVINKKIMVFIVLYIVFIVIISYFIMIKWLSS